MNWAASAFGVALATAEFCDASANWPEVQVGLQLCNAAYSSGANINNVCGNFWMAVGRPTRCSTPCSTPNSQMNLWSWCTDVPSQNNACEFSKAQSYHPGGLNVLMDDGSVRFGKASINQATWWALGTKANGEVIGSDSYKDPVGRPNAANSMVGVRRAT